MKHLLKTVLPGCIMFLASYSLCFAPIESDTTTSVRKLAPKVFFDCNRCDFDYVRREITFVNYVRDRKAADLHILVTIQGTGSGGREYTLHYLGLEKFSGKNDTLIYVSNQTDTDDEIREGLVKTLKLGLVRFAAQTPIADQLNISYDEEETPEEVVDKWNYWIFTTRVGGFFRGEESTSFLNLNGSIRANRITDNWKIRSNANVNYREENFTTSKGDSKFITKNYNFNALVVKSISDHWSIGGEAFVSTSTFSNTKFRQSIAPAIEYNIYPYSESTRKELRLLYSVNYNKVEYEEITIFDKTSETLFRQSLEITLELNQPWGQAETSFEASNYLHDLDLYRVDFFAELKIRLFKGFSLNLFGSVSSIHDQISLPKEEASDEEILLGRIQLPTSFRYFGSIGFSYTFGSIYSNIVNPRFGG